MGMCRRPGEWRRHLPWSLRVWSAGSTLPTTARRLEAEAVAESSVMAWNRNKEREGPRAEGHGPAPSLQRWALCFCLPSPLCCQKTHSMGSCRARWARRQSGGCRAGSVPRWCWEKERKGTLGAERKTTGLANPRENGSLGETRAGVQEPGLWLLSHERANSTASPCPALWERVVDLLGGGWEPGGVPSLGAPPPTNPPSSRNGQPLSPADIRPYCPGFCLWGFWREGRWFSSVLINAFCFDKMRKIRKIQWDFKKLKCIQFKDHSFYFCIQSYVLIRFIGGASRWSLLLMSLLANLSIFFFRFYWPMKTQTSAEKSIPGHVIFACFLCEEQN